MLYRQGQHLEALMKFVLGDPGALNLLGSVLETLLLGLPLGEDATVGQLLTRR